MFIMVAIANLNYSRNTNLNGYILSETLTV